MRCAPSQWAQWPVRGAARVVVQGGKGGGGDGPQPPGILTGLPYKGAGVAFMVANAPSSTLAIAAWWLLDTMHTSCLYLQPRHRPRRPKLMQAPCFPIQSWENGTFPRIHKSWTVNAGYSQLNDVATFWKNGGIEALDVGCGPVAVGRPV